MANQPKEVTFKGLALLAAGMVLLVSLTIWRLGGSAPSVPALLTTSDFSGPTMGTTYTVRVADPISHEEWNRLALIIVTALNDVDSKMSTYRDDSELSRFNAAQTTEPFAVSADTAQVFERALRVSRETEGAYDITVGPLVNAWGFGPEGPMTQPTDEEIGLLLSQVGYDKLKINVNTNEIWKWQSEIYCDLSSIAKGFASDKVAEALLDFDVRNFMVEVGGEVRAVGLNVEGEAWRIGIRKPVRGSNDYLRIVPLSEMSMATSGDYQNFYMIDGKRYSHIIDPRTGRPIESRLASVTVLHEECAMADAYATALTVLGQEAGLEFAEKIGLAAVFITREDDGTFRETGSPAYDALFPEEEESPATPQEGIL